MPGEGAAIAMYVQQNMRIPRRGEIGWSGEVNRSISVHKHIHICVHRCMFTFIYVVMYAHFYI
jgi:Cu/Ag efflux pump CusA